MAERKKATVGTTVKIDPIALLRGYEYCPNCEAFTMIPAKGKNEFKCKNCGYVKQRQKIDAKKIFQEYWNKKQEERR